MAQVTLTRKIKAPVEQVFSSWHDEYADIYKYSPGLSHSQLLDDTPVSAGKGATRQCDMIDGKNWLRERVLDVVPNRQLVIDIYESSVPLKSSKVTIDFKPISESESEIVFTMDFVPAMGLLGKMLVPMMKMQFKSNLQGMLDANAAYVETGQMATA